MTVNCKLIGAAVLALALAADYGFAYHRGAASRDAQVAQLKEQMAEQQAAHASAALTAQQALDRAQESKTQAVAAADQHATKEVSDAKQEHHAARAAVRSGTLGVRLNGADCASARNGALPASAAAAGVDDATAGGLPDQVAKGVLDLRFAIERDAAQIDGLQSYIRAVTSNPVTAPASAPEPAGSAPT